MAILVGLTKSTAGILIVNIEDPDETHPKSTPQRKAKLCYCILIETNSASIMQENSGQIAMDALTIFLKLYSLLMREHA